MAVSKRLALDTNVLLDRADNAPFAIDFCEEFQKNQFSLEVPPTVIAELDHFRTKGNDEEQRLAAIALSSLRSWGMTPIVLKDIEETYKDNFITIAQELGVLPAGEINDLHI